LWGVVGAERARHADYNYSDAIKSKKGIWSFEELAHFINNPKAFIPGTKMTFLGLKKASDIADTLLYLRSLSDAPLALPQPKVAAVAVDAKKAKAPTEHK
jgi:cytochrome c